MELNIYAEKKEQFEIKHFKDNIKEFLIRNQIKCSKISIELNNALVTFNTIVENEILNKEEEGLENLEKNIEETIKIFNKLKDSEIYEQLQSNEKSVFTCLIDFTKQYINTLKNNNFYYIDKIIYYETRLINNNRQENFNFTKKCFMLSLKNKRFSFDENIKKEINCLQKEYGFKDIFFRKPIDLRDKILLLKNIESTKLAIDSIANDLKIEKNLLSLNGLISISFEPRILGYSSATAYMRREEEDYVISLGKYDNLKDLKENYIHELAHCFDYTYKTNNNNNVYSYSEQSLIDLISSEIKTPIQKIMLKEIMLENYKEFYIETYSKMQREIIEIIKEDFDIKGSLDENNEELIKSLHYVINNYFKINIYKLLKVGLVLNLYQNQKNLREALELDKKIYLEDELKIKFNNLENKINKIRVKYNFILSENVSFFINEERKCLIEQDIKENKKYYTKPVEIFARAFELIYKEEKTTSYNTLKEEEKSDFKLLLKEALEYMLPKNNLIIKRIR